MGVETHTFSTRVPPDEGLRLGAPGFALYYSDSQDTHTGMILPPIGVLATSGFNSYVTELCRFIAALRGNPVLNQMTIQYMMDQHMGFMPYHGLYGQYFWWQGGNSISFKDNSTNTQYTQGLRSGILCGLPGGYDCVLLLNSLDAGNSFQTVNVIAQAFEYRGT